MSGQQSPTYFLIGGIGDDGTQQAGRTAAKSREHRRSQMLETLRQEMRRYNAKELAGCDDLGLLARVVLTIMSICCELGLPVPFAFDCSPMIFRISGSGAACRTYSRILSNTARGVPRFMITSERPSSSTRRRRSSKLVRARRAETTMLSLMPF